MTGKRFLNKVAIVTGASGGIGRATALALAREGAHLALANRGESALKPLAREIEALGREVLVMPTDVTDEGQVKRLVEAVCARWNRVDLLVASAGAYIRRPVVELTLADMERAMAINFYGALHAVLAVLPHMRAQRSGHIVLVNTMDAKKGCPPDAPYVASKFALAGFGEVLRQELRGSGVSVTSVFPGRVDTPMIENLQVPWISPKLTPEAVANAIVRGIAKRQPEVIVPSAALALIYLNTLAPWLADWAVRFFHLEGWER